MKVDIYDQVIKAALKWFKRLRSQNILVNGVLINEKPLYFAKELTLQIFQASDGCLDKWKKRLGWILFISDFFTI